MFESIKISDLPKIQCGILRESSNTRPAIRVVEENGVRAIVKDFSVNRPLFRNMVGRFLVWREAKAYKKLKGIKGVPDLYRVIDGLALVIAEVPGKSLEKLEREMKLPASFFDALKELVDRLHMRGIAHCDLKRAPNTILGHDGLPYIIDLGASISETEFRSPPLNLLYKRFLLDDYMAITKLKLRHIPGAISKEEIERYNYQSNAERFIRFIRDWARNFFQKIA
ncbi:MAG: hypothetical protein GY864_05495 [Desulfobacterales bacterium]|nr:hypothetical protein [Desulfobacterales bacterium]